MIHCLLIQGPCLFEFGSTFKYDNLYSNVLDIICTHKHGDHFNINTVNKLNGVFHEFELMERKELTYHIVYSYPANHRTAENPKHYVIESKIDGKRFSTVAMVPGCFMMYTENL